MIIAFIIWLIAVIAGIIFLWHSNLKLLEKIGLTGLTLFIIGLQLIAGIIRAREALSPKNIISNKIDLSIDENKRDFHELIQEFKDKRLVENLGK